METDELSAYLNSLEREKDFRVGKVLKQTPFETTQLVTLVQDGSLYGPFVRKIIKGDVGLGSAYEQLFNAQHKGFSYPHLPLVHECYHHDNDLVVVMEYIKGETLQDMVYRCNPSVALAMNVFPEICDAVSELHNGFNPPIIHRDIKPSNVIVREGRPILIDFGISRTFNANKTKDTNVFGTEGFAPPEQFGFGQTSVRSDVYALGMLLYFCLTEEIPSAGTRESVLGDEHIPYALQHVLATAIALDPADRFASVEALKNAFLNASRAPMQQPSSSPQQQAVDKSSANSTNRNKGAQNQQQWGETAHQTNASWTPQSQPTARISQASQDAQDQVASYAARIDDSLSQAKLHFGQSTGRVLWGILYNLIVIAVAIELVGIALPAFPATLMNEHFNLQSSASVIVYVLYIGWIVVIAFALLDKSRLRKRFPKLEKWQWWHGLISVIAYFGIMYFIAWVLAYLTGA